MVATQRAHYHLPVACVASVLTAVLGVCGWANGAPEWATTLTAAAVAVLALLAQSALLFWDPNRKPEANRVRAKGLCRKGELERLRGETPDLAKEELPRPRLGLLHAFALCGMALGILPFVSAELVRLALGWPLNRDWYPAVVGPRDESRFYFPETIYSVRGLWDGRDPAAELLNAPEVGLAPERLEATTHHDRWGDRINSKQEERWGSARTWVDVRIPDAPPLGGKNLRMRIDLTATYPADRGTQFVNEEQAFTQTAIVRLADTPRAGIVYASLCRGGALWLFLMSLALMLAALSFRHEAYPAKVVAESEEEDEDDDYPRRRARPRRIRGDD
jgi:hypothetical protein